MTASVGKRTSKSNLGITWTKQACDGLISCQLRLWLNMSIKQLGISLQLPSDVFINCQTTIIRILASSKDPDEQKIQDKKAKYVSNDEVIQATIKSTKNDKKSEYKRLLKKDLNEPCKSLTGVKKESIKYNYYLFLNANTTSQRIFS